MNLCSFFVISTAVLYDALAIFHLTNYAIKLHVVELKISAEPHDVHVHRFCRRYNNWAKRKLFMDIYLEILFLVTGNFFLLFFYLPVVMWNVLKFCLIREGQMGIFDSTAIYNQDQLGVYKRETVTLLNYHVLCYFLFSFQMAINMFSLHTADVIEAMFHVRNKR